MQGTSIHRLALLFVILVGANLALVGVANGGVRPGTAPARWPDQDKLYVVEGWISSSLSVTEGWRGVRNVKRDYFQPSNKLTAQFTIATNTRANEIYKAGTEVPFLGSGYDIDPVPLTITTSPHVSSFVARAGQRSYLVLHSRGERRGLLGTTWSSWAYLGLDAMLWHPNDYFRLALVAPLDRDLSIVARETAVLAESLFSRVAAWYGQPER